jgi:hypothetical protein
MQSALVGWLGLTILILATAAAIAADFLRQSAAARAVAGDGAGAGAGSTVRRLIGPLTVAAFALAAFGAVATGVRFLFYTT